MKSILINLLIGAVVCAVIWLGISWNLKQSEQKRIEEIKNIRRRRKRANQREKTKKKKSEPPPVQPQHRREEIRSKAEATPRYDGCVYCLSNKAMPGLFKIGYTGNCPYQRAKDLYKGRNGTGTGVPSPFKVEFYCECVDPPGSEMRLHRALWKKRFNRNREFFTGPIEEIEAAFREYVPQPCRFVRGK